MWTCWLAVRWALLSGPRFALAWITWKHPGLKGSLLGPTDSYLNIHDLKLQEVYEFNIALEERIYFYARAYIQSSRWKPSWVSHLHSLHQPAPLWHQGLVYIRKDYLIYRIALSWTEIILWFLSTGRANQCQPSSKRFMLVILSHPLHPALLETLEPILGLLLSSTGCKILSHSTSSSSFLYTQLPNSYNHFFQSSLISHTFIFHLNNQR